MKAITHRVVFDSRSDIYKLYPLGDIHAGTVYCSEDKIQEQVKAIKNDPLALWVGMGDYADLVTSKDKRWEDHTVAKWVTKSNIAEDQCEWVETLFKPIKNKCIGLLCGNHEIALRKESGGTFDFMINLTKRLGVPYLTYSAFVWLVFNRQEARTASHSFICYFTHGSGCPQTDGGKVMNLVRRLNDFEGDIYAEGHLHDIITKEKEVLRITRTDPPDVKAAKKCGAITGSWFQTYKQDIESSYGEAKCYSPTPIGCPVFAIAPSRDLVGVFSNTNMMFKRIADMVPGGE